jgi:hypothetical protein
MSSCRPCTLQRLTEFHGPDLLLLFLQHYLRSGRLSLAFDTDLERGPGSLRGDAGERQTEMARRRKEFFEHAKSGLCMEMAEAAI